MDFFSLAIENAKEISLLIAAIIGSFTAVMGVFSYRLKITAENNLKVKNEAEIDIKVIRQFSNLITIANGRSGYLLSESAVEYYLTSCIEQPPKNQDVLNEVNQNIENFALLTLPVGKASQKATAVALTDFAVKNPILCDAAKVGIMELPIDCEIKQRCLDKLSNKIVKDI